MAIGRWFDLWDGHTLIYTDGTTTLTAAQYEALIATLNDGPAGPSGTIIAVSATAPASPSVGDLWVDTT